MKIFISLLLLTSFSLFSVEVKPRLNNHQIVTLDYHDAVVTNVIVSPDKRFIASGDSDGSVIIWNTKDYEVFKRFNSDSYVRSIAWSPDSTKIVVSYRDKSIRIY